MSTSNQTTPPPSTNLGRRSTYSIPSALAINTREGFLSKCRRWDTISDCVKRVNGIFLLTYYQDCGDVTIVSLPPELSSSELDRIGSFFSDGYLRLRSRPVDHYLRVRRINLQAAMSKIPGCSKGVQPDKLNVYTWGGLEGLTWKEIRELRVRATETKTLQAESEGESKFSQWQELIRSAERTSLEAQLLRSLGLIGNGERSAWCEAEDAGIAWKAAQNHLIQVQNEAKKVSAAARMY